MKEMNDKHNRSIGQHISRAAFLIIGIVLDVWFILPFIVYGIINIGNITGFIAGLVLILIGVFEPSLRIILKKRWGKILLSLVALIITTGIVVACSISVLMIKAASRAPKGADNVLIILGCQVKGTAPSLMLQERLDAALEYLDDHADTICVLSGGQGSDESISEAECMFRYLTEHGIDPSKLIREDRSTTTRENLLFSLELLEKNEITGNIVLVTNEFHEYRAMKIAEKLGVEPSAISARTNWILLPTYFVREWFGVLYEWVGL